jgi:hypothetical protein
MKKLAVYKRKEIAMDKKLIYNALNFSIIVSYIEKI